VPGGGAAAADLMEVVMRRWLIRWRRQNLTDQRRNRVSGAVARRRRWRVRPGDAFGRQISVVCLDYPWLFCQLRLQTAAADVAAAELGEQLLHVRDPGTVF